MMHIMLPFRGGVIIGVKLGEVIEVMFTILFLME